MTWDASDTFLIVISIILYVLLIYLYFSEKYKISNKLNILFIIAAFATFVSTFTTAVINMLRLLDHNKYEHLWLFRIRTFLTALFSFAAGIIILIFMGSNKQNITLFSFKI